MRRVCCGCSTH